MIKKYLLFVLVGMSAFSVGCFHTKPDPQPGETVVGAEAGQQERADWIHSTMAYSEGLTARDPALVDAYAEGALSNPENIVASVFFGFDRSSIPSSERTKMDDIAERLWSNPNARLLVVGHCDWRGTHEYNLALGDRRATSVLSYLAQLGVDEGRIKTLSKGDLDASIEGTTEEMRKDRRSDVLFIING